MFENSDEYIYYMEQRNESVVSICQVELWPEMTEGWRNEYELNFIMFLKAVSPVLVDCTFFDWVDAVEGTVGYYEIYQLHNKVFMFCLSDSECLLNMIKDMYDLYREMYGLFGRIPIYLICRCRDDDGERKLRERIQAEDKSTCIIKYTIRPNEELPQYIAPTGNFTIPLDLNDIWCEYQHSISDG